MFSVTSFGTILAFHKTLELEMAIKLHDLQDYACFPSEADLDLFFQSENKKINGKRAKLGARSSKKPYYVGLNGRLGLVVPQQGRFSPLGPLVI